MQSERTETGPKLKVHWIIGHYLQSVRKPLEEWQL